MITGKRFLALLSIHLLLPLFLYCGEEIIEPEPAPFRVLYSIPENGNDRVPILTPITVTFSNIVDESTISCDTIKILHVREDDYSIIKDICWNSYSMQAEGQRIYLDTGGLLEEDALYSIVIPSTGPTLLDTEGNTPAPFYSLFHTMY